MRRLRRLGARAGSERGAVLVFVALALPVLIGMGGLVVDVGNWYAHKRHLQVQADAGALAAAGKFSVPSCNDSVVLAEAADYSSVGSSGPGKNPQIGGTPASRLHSAINSTTYYNQSTPVDASVAVGPPCTARMIDVKLTETGLPWLLKALNVVPYINAHARVEFKQKTQGSGSLPVGVPEVGPRRASVIFVNEATGAVLDTKPLLRTGTSNGMAIWSNAAAPAAVVVNTADVGVRIALGGGTSSTCGGALVDCYGAGTTSAIVSGTPGLAHVRGYATTPAGTTAAPQVRDVQTFGLTCEDGYFTATAARPCTVNVGAVVDFGGTLPPTSRVRVRKTGAALSSAVELTAPATAAGLWTGGGLSITSASRTTSFDILWQTGCDADRTKSCNKTVTTISSGAAAQRIYTGDEAQSASGPIKLVRISEGATLATNSFARSATAHNLVATIGLKPNLQNASSTTDPIVSLKVAGGGSQNQAVDCEAGANLRDQLAFGCHPVYKVNTGAACPDNIPQPFDCVPVSTGGKVGQVRQGMDDRILNGGTACIAPNHWSSFPNLPKGDPRIVSVFLTPFGSFTGSGNESLPVSGFATFYVTGWDSGGCQGQGDDPAGQGAIVGHYIKYIDSIDTGGGGIDTCDFDSLGACVSLFTR